MNITVLSRIIEKELDVFHWCLLKIIDNKEPIKEISQLSKIKSALSALIKKELISEINEEYILSDKAKEILHYIEEGVIIINTKETKPFFDVFVSSLFIEIENKIHSLTGKKNFRNPSTKFLKPSNSKDLYERLKLFFSKGYTCSYENIQQAILSHVEEAVMGKNKYALTIDYFIIKKMSDGTYKSELISYVDMMNDKQEVKKNVNTKDLF